jgi:hypothetical protein
MALRIRSVEVNFFYSSEAASGSDKDAASDMSEEYFIYS